MSPERASFYTASHFEAISSETFDSQINKETQGWVVTLSSDESRRRGEKFGLNPLCFPLTEMNQKFTRLRDPPASGSGVLELPLRGIFVWFNCVDLAVLDSLCRTGWPQIHSDLLASESLVNRVLCCGKISKQGALTMAAKLLKDSYKDNADQTVITLLRHNE
uniref:Bm9947 n=1 Tax=Brugia malayi TaxID=6279 RepID=A0A0J9XVI8_BRUMA|nr:Bm9947 [Brugia malayi]